MAKNIIISIALTLAFGCSLSAAAQDTIPTDSPQIVKEIIIRETRWKIVRDTVIAQPDSAITASLQLLNEKVVGIAVQQELSLNQQKLCEDKLEKHWIILKWIISIGIILILAILICLIYLILHARHFIKNQGVKTNQDVKNDDFNNNNSEQNSSIDIEIQKLGKPSLDSYNTSVYEFTTINDHVASLKRKETKTLVLNTYRYLAMQMDDKAALYGVIRTTQIPDDIKEQFVALVSRIDDFLTRQKPIIDAWLYWEPKDGIVNYKSAIRMPEGLKFDVNLDVHVLGDNFEGQQISMVHKMGFYFPGNTIKPYREKCVVSA